MYTIVSAEKGSYDSNIKISVLASAKNKPKAIEKVINLLKDELMMRMTDNDFESYGLPIDNREDLSELIKKDIETKVAAHEKKFYYENGESYIELNYNRLKTLSGYTIPCSSYNEYMGQTIAIIAGN